MHKNDATWSRTDRAAGGERADAGGRQRSRRRLPADTARMRLNTPCYAKLEKTLIHQRLSLKSVARGFSDGLCRGTACG
jgi:hypothetical protein